ncbi:hypothetical protein CHU98_g521 [Xylaria longipes]|nr:hypothetical protein CHU98_g521 [Xylaria longipes]
MRFLGSLAVLNFAATLLTFVNGIPALDFGKGNAISARMTEVGELPTHSIREAAQNVDNDVKVASLGKRDLKMRLWHAPGGQMLFLLGRNFAVTPIPPELMDLIVGVNQGLPGQLLLRNFYNYIQTRNEDLYDWLHETIEGVGKIGAIWGDGLRYGDFGFAFSIPSQYVAAGSIGGELFQNLVTEVQNWASQNGAAGDVAVQERANGFFNPSIIGGGPSPALKKRSRTSQCPNTNYNVLSIANEVVPSDVDINTYYRWTDPCPN